MFWPPYIFHHLLPKTYEKPTLVKNDHSSLELDTILVMLGVSPQNNDVTRISTSLGNGYFWEAAWKFECRAVALNLKYFAQSINSSAQWLGKVRGNIDPSVIWLFYTKICFFRDG